MDENLISQIEGTQNIYLIPPYLKQKEGQILEAWKSTKLEDHIFLFSSGTTSLTKLKSYMISKKSLLENARSVNEFLAIQPSDTWLVTLPKYHIGGLSIYARAYLSGSKIIELPNNKWNISNVIDILEQDQVSYFSLVPMQLLELIQSNIKIPKNLKGIFIGGDFLPKALADKAVLNGWPIIKTYGMTELSSQIASSFYRDIKDDFLEVLPIHKINNNTITSSSLYSGSCIFDGEHTYIDYNEPREFQLPDDFELLNDLKQYIRPLGRKDESIKIKGRLIDSIELKDALYEVFMRLDLYGKAEVVITKGQETGTYVQIYMINSIKDSQQKLEQEIITILPFLKSLLEFKYFDQLPRTSIGKIKRK